MSGDWASVSAELIPLALVVALSPVSVLPALLLVLYSARPRPAGAAFVAGWLIGLAVLTVVFLNIPKLLGDSLHTPATWQSWVRIGIGVALLAAGAWLWVRRGRSTSSPAWLDAIGKLSPSRTAALGLVLALLNPKIIVACAAAGLVIGAADFGPLGSGVAVVYFIALAASTTALPVLAHAVAAQRFDRSLDRLRAWIQRHQGAISAVTLVVIGVVLIYSGIQAL